MKSYGMLLGIVLLSSSTTGAQTLTASSNPAFPDVMYYQNCPYTQPGPAGLGQFWDFSAVLKNSTTKVFYTFNHDTGLDLFPSCNLAMYTVGEPSSALIKRTALYTNVSGLNYSGAIFGYSITVPYFDSEKLLTYPFNYGSSINDSWAGTYTLNGMSHTLSGTTQAIADGTGTLVTPAGTFSGVLRIHYTKNYTDVTGGPTPTAINYQEQSYFWYKPNEHGELLYISETTSPALTPSQTLTYKDIAYVGLSESNLEVEAIALFPNPARHELWLRFNTLQQNGEIQLTLLNNLGQKLYSHMASGEQLTNLDISALPNGLYYLLIAKENLVFAEKKFVVLK
jgi:Secretion system C-terminal sorting domain